MIRKRKINLLLLCSSFSLALFFLFSCGKITNTNVTEREEDVISLINDGEKWEDAYFVYAQAEGDNPLLNVEYDKGSNSDPKLSKELNLDLADYKKLSISIKGNYFIKLNLISKSDDNLTEYVDSFIIDLVSDYKYYEIDLDNENLKINKGKLIGVELIVTPSSKKHIGNFSIDKLQFEKTPLTVDGLSNDSKPTIINEYDSTTSIDSFSFNKNWYETSHSYAIEENESVVKVIYNILPNKSAGLYSKVQGNFSNFEYVNFTVKGTKNTKVLFTVESGNLQNGEREPESILTLTGEEQECTVFLDDLSEQTKNGLNRIVIIVEPDSLVPAIGELEIIKAEFSNTANVEKPTPTVNIYTGDNETFSFNHYWQSQNSLTSTITDGDTVTVNYTKNFATSSIYTKLEGKFSDFKYINIEISSEPNAEFLLQFDNKYSFRADRHVNADENGVLKLTTEFGLLFWPEDIDAISGFRITPEVNLSNSTGEFEIVTAEFSNSPLVTYEVPENITFDSWKQRGTNFTFDSSENLISWDTDSYENYIYTRVDGHFVENSKFVYRYFTFNAVVEEATTIEFEVDGAKYQVELTPDKTDYKLSFYTPTSGNADFWKFTSGFNLYLKVDTTNAGSIKITEFKFTNDTEVVDTVIDFNNELLEFSGMTSTSKKEGNSLIVQSFTKTQYNSLVYYHITPELLNGALLSDYDYLNIIIKSDNVSEFLVEISNSSAMQHYVTLENGEIQLTIPLKDIMLVSQINAINYINITPAPNSLDATGSFSVELAEFSKTPLVNYQTQTTVEIGDWKEIGSTFTIDETLKTISWNQEGFFRSLQVRMYGEYATSTELIYPKIIFNANVSENTIIELDIIGTIYRVELTPNQTVYEIDLTTPTSGNVDLWKFASGFNLYLKVDTTNAGSIELTEFKFVNDTVVVEDVIDYNNALLDFNGMTSASKKEGNSLIVESFTKTKYNSLVYYHITQELLNEALLSDYDYMNIIIKSDNVNEFLVEISSSSAMQHYVTLENGEIQLTMSLKDIMLETQINTINYINITPAPNSLDATGSFSVELAEFSKTPLVNYQTQTTVEIGDWKEIGSTFTIDETLKTISWNQEEGFRTLQVRMYGEYATATELIYPKIVFNANVTENTIIELDIIGTTYKVELTPNQTVYEIDLTTPTSGNVDLWKFASGFNLYLKVDTTNAGIIELTEFKFIK